MLKNLTTWLILSSFWKGSPIKSMFHILKWGGVLMSISWRSRMQTWTWHGQWTMTIFQEPRACIKFGQFPIETPPYFKLGIYIVYAWLVLIELMKNNVIHGRMWNHGVFENSCFQTIKRFERLLEILRNNTCNNGHPSEFLYGHYVHMMDLVCTLYGPIW
jgi:hypothetical protein